MIVPKLKEKDIKRFWSKVAITAQEDKCWEWQASKTPKEGYGRFSIQLEVNKNINIPAHRYAFIYENKLEEVDDDLYALHRCDNTSCVNPKHIFLGTLKDNMQDKVNKGRHNASHGEKHFRAIFDKEKVIDVRKRKEQGETLKSIAEYYGCSQGAIFDIVHRINWAHIE